MTQLRTTIERLASDFATNLIHALRGASIDELLQLSDSGRSRSAGAAVRTRGGSAGVVSRARQGRGGRLGRRSVNEIEKMVEAIADLLKKTPSGLRAEQIREALGVEAKELPRPLADGLTSGRLTKTGQKRATTYFAGSATGGAPARGRRAAKKKR